MHSGPKPRTATLVLAGFVVVFAPSFARADPSSPPLRVEYAAPGGCPTEIDFEAGVRTRTPFARFVSKEAALPVRVSVKAVGATYAGHLTLVSRSGRVSERDVEDALCANVVDALALVTALAIDPNATLSRPASPAPPPAAPPPAAPPEAPAAPLVSPSLAIQAPPPRTVHVEPDVQGRAPPLLAPRRWRAAVGGSFITTAGIAPDAFAGGGAFGEIEDRSLRALAPSARLTVYAEENGVFHARSAAFVLVAARADACPVRLGGRDVSIRPCVGVDVGGLEAEGEVPHPNRRLVAWFDASASLRARWVPGGGPFFVEVEGGILVPVTRPSYYYGETTGRKFVDNLSDVAVSAAATTGLRFW